MPVNSSISPAGSSISMMKRSVQRGSSELTLAWFSSVWCPGKSSRLDSGARGMNRVCASPAIVPSSFCQPNVRYSTRPPTRRPVTATTRPQHRDEELAPLVADWLAGPVSADHVEILDLERHAEGFSWETY